MRGDSVRLCALMLIHRIVKHVYACMLAWATHEWAVWVGMMRVGCGCWGLGGYVGRPVFKSWPGTTHPPPRLAHRSHTQGGGEACSRGSACAWHRRSARYHLGIDAHNSSRAHKLACETASPS